jgi:RES domain-containing protein
VPRELPPDWNQRPYRSQIRAIGDDWALARRSLGLQVPSAVCPPEENVIINPCHEDFSRLVVAARTPFPLDDRLVSTVHR